MYLFEMEPGNSLCVLLICCNHSNVVVPSRATNVAFMRVLQAAVVAADTTAQEQKSWELFTWLRQREKFGIRQQPAELAVPAVPIRGNPLDFGGKLTICTQKPAAMCTESDSSTKPCHAEPGQVRNTEYGAVDDGEKRTKR
jgi:hypothetical protein